VHLGRQVALTDGTSEVPFVDDGAGGVVARWPLAESVSLGVSARFGEVVIREPEEDPHHVHRDEPPKVTLEGAPRRVTIATDEDDGTIPVRYEAEDDHGLREVHLVLRSGVREERRVLAHLDGEIRQDRGGYLLRRTDPFLKKSHAPVEVTVEAKDNDPVTGPKWGRERGHRRHLARYRRARGATASMPSASCGTRGWTPSLLGWATICQESWRTVARS
jgi:hypothetical protein